MSDDMPTGEKLAKSALPAVTALPEAEITRLNDEIVTALKTVYDPEIPADCSEIRSEGRARGRLFRGPPGSSEASSAANPRAAAFCERGNRQACGRGGWPPPSPGFFRSEGFS